MYDEKELDKIKKALMMYLLLTIYTIPLSFVVYYEASSAWSIAALAFSLAINVGLLVLMFIKEAKTKPNGIKFHLHFEKNFLFTELPNILQFITILSISSFYLRNTLIRAVLAVIVSLLLIEYLKMKRNDLLSHSSKAVREKASPMAFNALHTIVTLVASGFVFISAELLAQP